MLSQGFRYNPRPSYLGDPLPALIRRLRLAPLLLLLFAAGCVADGTDYEALPFFRIDRTEPGITRVDVPPLLLTADTYPAQKDEDAEAEDAEADAADEDEEEDRDYLVRWPWPFGILIGRGPNHNWLITSALLADTGLTEAGPAGRALSSDPAVRKDLLVAFASDPESGGVHTLPFVFSSTLVDHNHLPDLDEPDLDRDVHLWPLFAWGSGDDDGEDYLAVLPFGGVTRGLLGKEKITWYGFPYPLYAEVEDRSYKSHHILFPFINWVDGPNNSGFRVLPFYGHYERTGRRGNPIYERTYIMWPFFTWSTSGMNEPDGPTETFFAFPWYGRIKGPNYGAITFLWPLFKYEQRRGVVAAYNLGQGGGYKDTGEGISWELRAPFPFVQIAGGPDGSYKFDLWPLFGVKERPGFSRHFALWPIWRYEDLEAAGKRFHGRWFLPLVQYTSWEEIDSGKDATRLQVWPLMHYRKFKDTSMEIATISPWLFFDGEGYNRILAPFFRLFRYYRDADGGTEHQALMGLFSYRDLPAVPERDKSAYSRLSLLFGLFQYRNKGGESGLRFLWLLPELTWGGEGEGSEP